MSGEQETILHRWFEEVWNKGRTEVIDEMLAPDCIAHGLIDGHDDEKCGPAEFKPFFESFRGAFTDLHITVEETIVEGYKIAARCRVRGTHTGEGLDVMPTGQPVEFSGICIVHVRNGQITESWNHFDVFTMYQQIGKLELIA